MQSSEDPNPRPLQHTPLQAILEEGFRTPAEATDEDVRLARRGGNRFGEDDLAGDPEAVGIAGQPTGWRAARAGSSRTRSSGPSRAARTRVQDIRSANNMNDATQPQHFTLRTGSSTSGSPASSRASSQSGFRVQAQSNTPRPFSWGLNPVALPQSQPSSRASSSSRRSLPPPSFDQLARDIEAA